jgi:hypothetical protein
VTDLCISEFSLPIGKRLADLSDLRATLEVSTELARICRLTGPAKMATGDDRVFTTNYHSRNDDGSILIIMITVEQAATYDRTLDNSCSVAPEGCLAALDTSRVRGRAWS